MSPDGSPIFTRQRAARQGHGRLVAVRRPGGCGPRPSTRLADSPGVVSERAHPGDSGQASSGGDGG